MIKRYGQTMRFFYCTAVALSLFIALCGFISLLSEQIYIGVGELVIGIALTVYFVLLNKSRKKLIKDYTRLLGGENTPVSSNIMSSFPIPIVVTHIDGSVRWYNEKFSRLMNKNDMSDCMLEKILPQIKWSVILKNASNIDIKLTIDGKKYWVIGNMLSDKTHSSAVEDRSSIYLYFVDKTAEYELKELYNNEKTDVAIVNIDNYEEVLQRINDNEHQQVTSKIRKYLNEWAGSGNAILKNTDRDRYFVIFEHKYLKTFTEDKFSVLENIRAIGENIKIPVSVSIGIGCGGNINDNELSARNALDMALGRGGDQVCIKDDTQYSFFGGKSREYEKSTRVKTRAVAIALKDFIIQSDKVIFVGHSSADYDCFGAAMGLQRAVRTLGKVPYIIYDNNSPAVKPLYDEMREKNEYKGMFISVERALEEITDNTLLVVLDTNRPSMLPDIRLLEYASKIVMIDHHRRSTDFINPCSLIYHEPYASSACEMSTELLEYMDLGSSLTATEAECLYTGILMDTKNFMLKTGVRTFDAASYLKRLGLNTMSVKRLFNTTKTDYDHKADIVKTAQEIVPGIAVARTDEKFANIKVVASQAADDMLNIGNIRASFVVYVMDNSANISARSIGDINVQLILEKLGGGGHMTVAGAQLRDTTIEQAIQLLNSAVNEYIKEN